ncbi:MAG: hypothetical protein LQ340_005362 [Diploschistes diacapsis]|nr:MAG: hypothetical protein LQ340_005362 [Diploschistes diacapsis]
MLALLLCVVAALQLALAKIVTHDWHIGWTTAAPDGFERPVIGINGQFPCPTIDVDVGDRIVVKVYNGLGNQSTGIHWHGMHQNGTAYMDGTTGGSQCPIPPNSSLTYDFVVSPKLPARKASIANVHQADQSGTYWYHSHNLGQYPDGLWGPLIVRGGEPWAGQIDGEFIVTLTDWYHQQMPVMIKQYQSNANENGNNGNEPEPDAALVSLSPNSTTWKVEPDKTYLFRIICVGNFPGHGFFFDQHAMTIVEVDGIWTQPYEVNTTQQSRVTTGQRQSVLVKTLNSTAAQKNYAFFDTMDVNMMFFDEGKTPPPGFNPNATAHLVYDESAPLPAPPVTYEFDFVDDVNFYPLDKEPLLEPVDHQIILDFNSANISDVSRFAINGQTYLSPQVPSLYSAISTGSNNTNPIVYGQTNPFVLQHNAVVEIVMNDYHTNLHPFHLHGHQFQTLLRTAPNGGYYSGTTPSNVSATPMRRDTLMVQNGGHAVIRFRADNPGVWLLHCHIEWHTESGLIATIVEAPELLQGVQVPQDHLQACKKYGLPDTGNSLGNVSDPLGSQTYHVPLLDEG